MNNQDITKVGEEKSAEASNDFVFNSPPKKRLQTLRQSPPSPAASKDSNSSPVMSDKDRRKMERILIQRERERKKAIKKILKPAPGVWINNEKTRRALQALHYKPTPKWDYPHDPDRPLTPPGYWSPGWWSPPKNNANSADKINDKSHKKNEHDEGEIALPDDLEGTDVATSQRGACSPS